MMFLISSSPPPRTHVTTLDVVCAARCPALLQLEDGGMEALFCTLAQYSPTEVKIVPCSILLQQSQRWLSQKQYLDMAADVPKQAQEDRPARGTFGTVRLHGEWGKSCKQCGLWGHLRGEHKCCLESLLETLDLWLIKNMPLQIKCASWEWEFASLFLARLPSVNKLSSFIWERRKRSSLLLSCLLLGFYVVRYVRTETVNYGKWALMLAFRSKQYYRCQVSQAKKGASLLPFPAPTEELHVQKCSSRESLDVLAWGTYLLIFISEAAKFFCGAEPGWSLMQSDF